MHFTFYYLFCVAFFLVVQAGFTQNRLDIEEENGTIDVIIFKQGLTSLTLMVNLTATYDNAGKNKKYMYRRSACFDHWTWLLVHTNKIGERGTQGVHSYP